MNNFILEAFGLKEGVGVPMTNYIGYEVGGMGFDAHITLIVLPDILSKEQFEDTFLLMKEHALPIEEMTRDSLESWGPNKIMKVKPSETLHELHYILLDRDTSSYVWNPHVTLSYSAFDGDIILPRCVVANRPYIKWNDQRYYIFD